MSEEILREVIGLAKKSKWNQVKKFIKFIVQKTLKKGAGYNLNAQEASIKGKKKVNFNFLIKSGEKINKIENITSFSHLTLFQSTQNSNDFIEVSQNNGTIMVLAKYLGPVFNNSRIFDFSIHLDAVDEPFFTIGTNQKIYSSEILNFIKTKSVPNVRAKKKKIKKDSKKGKQTEIKDIENYVFEELTGKKSIWNGSETKAFQRWKAKLNNSYRLQTGKITYYKGKATKKYTQYLENLLENKEYKNKKPVKKVIKKKSSSKKDNKEISEKIVFENLSGKNAIWNGSETKNFIGWKHKTHKRYNKDTGNHPYYRGKLTQNYQKYLKKLSTSK